MVPELDIVLEVKNGTKDHSWRIRNMKKKTEVEREHLGKNLREY